LWQEWVYKAIREDGVPSFIGLAPMILMAVVISIMDELYKQVAKWLNNKGQNFFVKIKFSVGESE
jgi:hypothetical protein